MLRYAISDGSLALEQRHIRQGEPDAATPSRSSPESFPAQSFHVHPAEVLRKRLLIHAAFLAATLAARQIDFFLLREPTLSAGQLAVLSRDLLRIFAGTPTRLLIHSRLDIAIATRAQGVHLPSMPDQVTPAQIRTLYASADLPNPTISLSCHNDEELRRAHTLHPDLILFGPIFGKQVQGATIHSGVGVASLRDACGLAYPIPVLALGGVTEANTQACVEAGASGVAAIRLFAHPQLN